MKDVSINHRSLGHLCVVAYLFVRPKVDSLDQMGWHKYFLFLKYTRKKISFFFQTVVISETFQSLYF